MCTEILLSIRSITTFLLIIFLTCVIITVLMECLRILELSEHFLLASHKVSRRCVTLRFTLLLVSGNGILRFRFILCRPHSIHTASIILYHYPADCYVLFQTLMEVFPEGVMVPKNIWQAEFMHYPKQQETAMHILIAMERNSMCCGEDNADIYTHISNQCLPC